MACSQSNTIGVGTIQIAAELALAAVTVLGSIYYYKKVKDDVDSLKSLSDRFMTIGDDYCNAQRQLETFGTRAFEYSRSIQPYHRTSFYSYTGMASSLANSNEQLLKINNALPAYDKGTRCEARHDYMRNVVSVATNSAVKGILIDRSLQEEYLSRSVKSRVAMVADSPPSIEGTMSVLTKITTEQLANDNTSFNSFMYGAGRSITSLVNRYTGAYSNPNSNGIFSMGMF